MRTIDFSRDKSKCNLPKDTCSLPVQRPLPGKRAYNWLYLVILKAVPPDRKAECRPDTLPFCGSLQLQSS